MTAPKLQNLRQRALRAGSWSFFGFGVSQVLRLASNLIMTRLLVPEMFGVMAIATMLAAILSLLSDLGVHQNIVQSRRGDDPAFLNTAWTLGLIRGLGLWAVAIAIAAALYLADRAHLLPANSVYAAPLLPYVIAVNSLSAVTSSLASTKISTAARRLDQKRIMQIELASQVVAMAVMVVIGLATRSIWALVTGSIVASLLRSVLSHSWMQGQPNRFCWDKEALHELLHFGKWVYFSSIMSVLASNGDRLLLGGFVVAEVMGLYAIAILIVSAIEYGMVKLFVSVSLPALSEVARDEPRRLREIYYKLRAPSDLALLFVSGVLFAAGQLVIDVLYDHRYAEAGGMVQILALSLTVIRYGVAHQVFLAVGKPRYQTIVNGVQFLALFTLVPLAFSFAGTQAAIWAVALHALTTVPFIFYFQGKLGVNDFRKEALFLVAFPAGYLAGAGVRALWG